VKVPKVLYVFPVGFHKSIAFPAFHYLRFRAVNCFKEAVFSYHLYRSFLFSLRCRLFELVTRAQAHPRHFIFFAFYGGWSNSSHNKENMKDKVSRLLDLREFAFFYWFMKGN